MFADFIPLTPPIFQTSLSAPCATTDTACDLASVIMDNGNQLQGLVGVSIDIGQPNPEYALGTLSGNTLTFIVRGIDPLLPRTSDASLVSSHRRGAVVKVTDFMAICLMRDLLNGTTPFENILSYLTHPTFTPGSTQIPDVGYVDTGDANTLATAEAFAIAYADRVAGLSSGIGGKPMTFAFPDSSDNITPVPVYMNKEALIFFGKGATATTVYLMDTDGLIMSRVVTLDWASATKGLSACLIGGSFFVLLTDGTNYRVYKYDATNLSTTGVEVTFVGGSLGTVPGLVMTTNNTDFFFTNDGGNASNDASIARYTVASTTFTYNSTTVMTGGTGYFTDGFGVDDNLVYYGFSLSAQNISKWNSSGALQYTSGTFQFVAGFRILSWANTYYVTDVNANQDVVYVKLYVPGSDLSPATPVTTAPLVYGETIALNDYVFEADGNEAIVISQPNGANESPVSTPADFVAQAFTTDGRATGIQSVGLYLRRPFATVTGNATVQIFATALGVPTGPALGTSVPTSVGSLPTTPDTLLAFDFAAPVAVLPGVTYAFVLNTSGLTYGGRSVDFAYSNAGGTGYLASSDSGTTWTSSGIDPLKFILLQGLTVGSVYRVDITTPITDMGPYMGFAQQAGLAGETHPVQLLGIASGFVPTFTLGGEIYIDPATPGGITQTPGPTAGRCVGVAIGAHSMVMMQMRRRDSVQGYTGGTVLNQDGFVMARVVGTSLTTVDVVETNEAGSTVIFSMNPGDTFVSPVTFPVRAGCSYNLTGDFFPLIYG